jgi:hypothetical protein
MRFSAPVQTGPEPTQLRVKWVTDLLPVVKGPGHEVAHPPQANAEVKEKVELYL